jgi:hypothetical protein
MAEIRIPVEKLPAPDKNGDHAFQFRIISVDKNQWSAWSQLYVVKSIGQYKPKMSPVSASIQAGVLTVNWVTPLFYNYDGTSNAVVEDPVTGLTVSNSASVVQHNHSLDSRAHNTDVFVQFSSGSVMGDFGYFGRVPDDTARILVPTTSASVRVIGTVATKNIPQPYTFDTALEYGQRFNEYIGVSASVQGTFDLFKIFDTGIARIPVSASVSASTSFVSSPTNVSILSKGDLVATQSVFMAGTSVGNS